jgi:4-hydroxyphenylacetaldehyde oxime monooxygenase
VTDGIIGTVAFGSMYGAATFAGWCQRFHHVLDEAMVILSGFAAEDFFPNAAGRLAEHLAVTIARRERVFKDLDAFFKAVIDQRMDARRKDDNGGGQVNALVGLWK